MGVNFTAIFENPFDIKGIENLCNLLYSSNLYEDFRRLTLLNTRNDGTNYQLKLCKYISYSTIEEHFEKEGILDIDLDEGPAIYGLGMSKEALTSQF